MESRHECDCCKQVLWVGTIVQLMITPWIDLIHIVISLADSNLHKFLINSQRSRTRRDTESARRDATPLLPEGALPKPKPPQSGNESSCMNVVSIINWFCVQGPEFDDEDNDREDVMPSHGIDDGFFDDRNELDGRGEKIPLPATPRTNGIPPRRGSVPSVFPYSPPDYGGPGVVRTFLESISRPI